ncbi:MAG: LysR substrate-binding domain-containing protein [Micropruina glycogenica]
MTVRARPWTTCAARPGSPAARAAGAISSTAGRAGSSQVGSSDGYVVVQNLVARGLGVTALPRLALQAFRHPGVAVRASALFGRRTVGAVHRGGAEQVPSIRALLERLQRAAAHLPD